MLTTAPDLSTAILPIDAVQPLQIDPSPAVSFSTSYPASNLPFELTAEAINPKIRLFATLTSEIDLTVKAYTASVRDLGTLFAKNDYILTADEARQVLATLPAQLPIITSVQRLDVDPSAPRYDIRWYSLSADGTFEVKAYSDWQTVTNRLQGIETQSTPMGDAVTAVLPDLPLPQALPVVNEPMRPSSEGVEVTEVKPIVQRMIQRVSAIEHSTFQAKRISSIAVQFLQAESNPPSDVFRAIQPAAPVVPEFDLAPFTWSYPQTSSIEPLEPIQFELQFEIAEPLEE
ncbi:hypothetical protein IQ250_01755 [Pseudanabaenaceae cyanobacterium LEGE 13415]|nr:hypothetical protein [Pseudanabaenaceae cyanobacterium LEGE 13415]